jgi:hypothetical protein
MDEQMIAIIFIVVISAAFCLRVAYVNYKKMKRDGDWP